MIVSEAYAVRSARLTGTLSDMDQLTSLFYLGVNAQSISGSMPKIPTSLATLDVSKNMLSGVLPVSVAANLTYISSRDLEISGTIGESFKVLNLKHWFMFNTRCSVECVHRCD